MTTWTSFGSWRSRSIFGQHSRRREHYIDNAGRGAFAARQFSKGFIATTTPVIHIFEKQTVEIKNRAANSTQQLLLNSCFGHRKSLLFCYVLQPMQRWLTMIRAELTCVVRLTFATKLALGYLTSSWRDSPILSFVMQANIIIKRNMPPSFLSLKIQTQRTIHHE